MNIEESVRNLFSAIAGFTTKPYDKIVINYTDATKATIDNVVYYNNNKVVGTLTQTQATTSDTWTKT